MSLINKKYLLLEKIGEGSFGCIYKGKHIRTNEFVAIKVEKNDCNTKILKREALIYQYINNNNYTPQIKWFGKDIVNHYMVINLLGGSLKEKLQVDGSFSLIKTLEIGLQMIEIIEFIHNKGLIHRDIKPDNFLYDTDNYNKIYIIDFGFCKNFIVNNQHIREKKLHNIIGSFNYASINSHELNELSRRDDLESIGYMLLFLYLNTLPWKNEGRETIKQMKMNITNDTATIPDVFIKFLKYSKSLTFVETPDYNYIKNILKTMLVN